MKELEDDKRLVAKVGKEELFYNKFKEIERINKGTLGWTGQAELMLDLLGKDGLQVFLGIKLKSRKKENLLKEIEYLLKEAFYQSLLEYGEWVDKEVAETRAKYYKVLYAEKDSN